MGMTIAKGRPILAIDVSQAIGDVYPEWSPFFDHPLKGEKFILGDDSTPVIIAYIAIGTLPTRLYQDTINGFPDYKVVGASSVSDIPLSSFEEFEVYMQVGDKVEAPNTWVLYNGAPGVDPGIAFVNVLTVISADTSYRKLGGMLTTYHSATANNYITQARVAGKML